MSKTVLITGGASGIGKGLALHLANNNRVIITDLDLEQALSVAEKINRLGGNAHGFQLDVTQGASINNLKIQLQQQQLNVEVLINNAGVQHVEKLDDYPEDKWLLLQNVMVSGVFRTIQAFLPGMKENNYGRIINIGSVHSLVASPFKVAYVAAKHAIIGLGKAVALETCDHDITINTLCPAYVKTPLVEKQIASQAKNHGISEQQVIDNIMLKPMPKKAFIEISELAGTSQFLMSSAAKNITAQAIVLDGGWTAQ